MAKTVTPGRTTALAPPGTVVFLIGMRANRPWKVRTWLPTFLQMPRMLSELRRRPELGLLHLQTFWMGQTVLLLEYWRDADSLNAYATARDHHHLPAWREFNRRVRASGDVGVFHETYVLDRYETIYVNMPSDFGLGGATEAVAVSRRGQRAAARLDPSVPDIPAVRPD
ncbi:MAG: DUF4188 domain-containing protein [Chloroflexi bacterium]|nr:DUF4188 domain-containing protein [Chloroflexota bacterium]